MSDFKIQEIDYSPETVPMFRGSQIYKMPQPKLTTPSIVVPNTGDAGTDNLMTNMITRIGEIEAILKKAGMLKTN